MPVQQHQILLAEAAWDAVQIPLRQAQRGRSMAQLALCGAARFEQWRHYPATDARDAQHGSQFYFHAHAQPRCKGEHGHFHLFQRAAQPGSAAFHHLVALSIDALGRPLRWFTTNAWVTGEQWLPASALCELLPRYTLVQRGRLAPLARWLQSLVRLHAAELARLLRQRDAALARAARGRSLDALLQDRQLQLLSQREIRLAQRLQDLTPLT
ncbi:DUF6969 family protein [Paucibacter soli]|uniref:DUF6969 family protein n=1 Tax=Paucibacter soli TaxID=3133433 RepID=UPI0030B6425F